MALCLFNSHPQTGEIPSELSFQEICKLLKVEVDVGKRIMHSLSCQKHKVLAKVSNYERVIMRERERERKRKREVGRGRVAETMICSADLHFLLFLLLSFNLFYFIYSTSSFFSFLPAIVNGRETKQISWHLLP